MSLADAAAGYLAAGYRLLALSGKRPNRRYHQHWDWENSIHGTPETQADRDALAGVFDDPSTTGIALLIPQHVLVADVDTEEAAGLFRSLVPETPQTPTSRTMNGLHIWYLAPGADSNRWIGGRTLLFKGFGGYVVAPPSAHFTDDTLTEQDGVYTWVRDIDSGFEFLPDRIGEHLARVQEYRETTRPPVAGAGARAVVRFKPEGGFTLHGEWDIEGLERAIENAAWGNQNNLIHWAALTALEGGVPYSVAMDRLLAAALRGGHPRRRAVTTIKGVYARGSGG